MIKLYIDYGVVSFTPIFCIMTEILDFYIVNLLFRYRQKPPITWPAITTPLGVFVICMLVGYILHAAHRRFINVVENCRKMEELKVKAEAADIAKSQV